MTFTPANRSNAIGRLASKVGSWLTPEQHCRLCSTPCAGSQLCPSCNQDVTRTRRRCYRCALPLSNQADGDPLLCGECLTQRPPFHRTVCINNYDTPLDQWLHNFKYHRDLRDGRLLSSCLTSVVTAHYQHDTLPKLITFVAQHWRKTLWRSFNQSAFITHHLHNQLGIEICSAFTRRHALAPQKEQGRKARRTRLRGVYKLRTEVLPLIQEQHIAIVDDVITTGATASTLSDLLISAGAARVDIWALARTDKRHNK